MTHLKRLGFFLVVLSVVCAAAEKKNATLQFVILKETTGKPIKNAEVVLHPLDKNGKQKQEGMELKTHEDGKAEANGIPYGRLRVQVIVPGYKTYGEDYDVNQSTLEITIKMQKPVGQVSIYK